MTKWQILGLSGLLILFAGCTGGLDDEKLAALPPQEAGRKVVEKKCLTCHTIQGQGGTRGPNLSSIGERLTPEGLKQFITDPQSVKPNSAMRKVHLSGPQIDWVVAYLSELK